MTDSFCGSRLNGQRCSGHGIALKDYGLSNLVGTKVDEHLSTISAEVRDRLGLEHSVVWINHTTEGLGKHFPKEAGKTSMVNRRGLAAEGGVSEEVGHSFQGKLAGVLGWFGLLSGNAAASKREGF